MYTLSHIYILMHTELMVLYLNLYFLFSRVFTGIAQFDGEYLSKSLCQMILFITYYNYATNEWTL